MIPSGCKETIIIPRYEVIDVAIFQVYALPETLYMPIDIILKADKVHN
jgi:hypothetical protein